MFCINPAKAIQNQLVVGMGLDKYAYITQEVQNTNVAEDKNYQRIFNSFYIVRRNAEWRDFYYKLFEKVKKGPLVSFEQILSELFYKTRNMEASFASKMLATINPDMAIWDRYVIQNLNIKLPSINDPNRLTNTCEIYEGLNNWYKEYLATDNAQECIKKFDETLPDYTWLSEVKKIDYFLWSTR